MVKRLQAVAASVLAGSAVSLATPWVSPRALWQSTIACSGNYGCHLSASSTGAYVAAIGDNINVFGGSTDVTTWPSTPLTALTSSGFPIRGATSCAWSPGDAYVSCVAFPSYSAAQVAIWQSSSFASSAGSTSSLVSFTSTMFQNGGGVGISWSPDGRFLAFGEPGFDASGIQIYGGNNDPTQWSTSSYNNRLTGLQGGVGVVTWITSASGTYIYAVAGSKLALWGGTNDPTSWPAAPVKTWSAGNGIGSAFYANGYLVSVFGGMRCTTLVYGNGNADPTTWSTTPTLQLNNTCIGALSPDGSLLVATLDSDFPNSNQVALYGGSSDIGSWPSQPIATSPPLSITNTFTFGMGWGAASKVIFSSGLSFTISAFAVLPAAPSPTPSPVYPAISSAPMWSSAGAACPTYGVCSPVISNTGQWLAAVPYSSNVNIFGGSANVNSWSSAPLTTLTPSTGAGRYKACGWSPDDAYIACVASVSTTVAAVAIWESSSFASSAGGSVTPAVAFTTTCPPYAECLVSVAWSSDGSYLALGESGSPTGIQIFGGNTDPTQWSTNTYRNRLTGLPSDAYAVTWISNKQATYLYAVGGGTQALWGGSIDPTTWSATPLKTWVASWSSNPKQAFYANGFLVVCDFSTYTTIIYGNGNPDPTTWSTNSLFELQNAVDGALSPDGRYYAVILPTKISLYGGSTDINSWSTAPVASQQIAGPYDYQAAWAASGKWVFGVGRSSNVIAAFAVATPSPSPSAPPTPSSSPSSFPSINPVSSPSSSPAGSGVNPSGDTTLFAGLGGALGGVALIGAIFYGYRAWKGKKPQGRYVQDWAGGDNTSVNGYAAGLVPPSEAASSSSSSAYSPL